MIIDNDRTPDGRRQALRKKLKRLLVNPKVWKLVVWILRMISQFYSSDIADDS